MKIINTLAMSLAGWVLMSALLAAPASAHSSNYCGHGISGIMNTTRYVSSHLDSFAHYHNREHKSTTFGLFGWVVSTHHDTKVCGVPTQGHF